jgi:hypothetical protein
LRWSEVTGIAYDRQQPGAAVNAVKTAKGFQGAQISFLHYVFRVMVVAR